MISEILGKIFPVEHGLSPKDISVTITIHDTPFALSDDKSCDVCQSSPKMSYRKECNREILKVDNNGETIEVVNFEQYLSQYEKIGAFVGERCDYLMTDAGMERKKIVFCELCCYSEKFVEPNEGNAYPQGKRAKVYQQMEKSIETLVQQSTTAVNLLTYGERCCLFAWRDYDVPDIPVMAARGDARSNMLAFGSTTASQMAKSTTSHEKRMGYNFIFKQVKYPSTYLW